MQARIVTECRVCNGPLRLVLDLGVQCLAGQFPKPDEPDPPAHPLQLMSCRQCRLLQLSRTVDPRDNFTSYWYRSGITQTMRAHLASIAEEASQALGRVPKRILDIGCNTGELLQNFPNAERLGVDPCAVAKEAWEYGTILPDFYPTPSLAGEKFDLIFSVAMFYDVDQPVAFAREVRENLADGGLWIVEVADAKRMLDGIYDGICHEHLCYFDPTDMDAIGCRAGLDLHRWHANDCNGGSLRFMFRKGDVKIVRTIKTSPPPAFSVKVHKSLAALGYELLKCANRGETVHLLGASTKINTVLQSIASLKVSRLISAASDRDPRKHGRVTPGTRIPIISEEESRAMRPDCYLVGPAHFRAELLDREREFRERGGKFIFPLPEVEVI